MNVLASSSTSLVGLPLAISMRNTRLPPLPVGCTQ